MTQVLSGVIVAAIGLLGVWITARVTLKGNRDSRDISWFDRLTARVDLLEEKNAKLAAEVEEVKLDRFALRVVLQAFVEHVHQWRRRTPPSEWPEVPREVAERMGDESL